MKVFIDQIEFLYDRIVEDILNDLPESIQEYFTQDMLEKLVVECRHNSSGLLSFQRRFFHWFDAFMLMKYLHYMRSFFPDIKVVNAVLRLFEILKIETTNQNTLSLLNKLREIDRKGYFP